MRITTKKAKIQQRLEWIEFRLTAMGWCPEEIELELQYIREKQFDKVEPCTKALLDFETFKILSE
jgi:hypothetical protein